MEGVGKTLSHRHSTNGQTALCLHLWLQPHCCLALVDVTYKPTVPAGPIMSSLYWRLPSLPSPLCLAGAGHRSSLVMRCHSQLARPHALFDADRASKVKESVRNCQAMLVRRRLRGEMFEIVLNFFHAKSFRVTFHFTPKLSVVSDQVVVIAEESDFLYSLL